jgi:hypothetical protein
VDPEVTAAAKQAAKAKKRAAQKAKKIAAGVNPAEITAGKVHLSDMRSAQRLWSIFPHDLATKDLVLKYSGGIEVPESMGEVFTTAVVTDGRWGLYVNPTRRDLPQPDNRLVLRPASLRQQAKNAAALAGDLQKARRRMRSRSPLRRRTKGPMQYARPKSGSRQAETPRPAAKQFRISSPSPGPGTKSTRRWWADLLEEEEQD